MKCHCTYTKTYTHPVPLAAGWAPIQGGTIKYPVRNAAVHRYLRQLLPGKWQKVIKKGNTGDVHYFEHASGQVADVKYFPTQTNV